ncbi:MAG TPA: hypothetical protein VK462_08885 [Nitrososphaeraceae archaeon]|jgi:hypothetical protein|nr:hypothetical protein [Nitrososphaeraceae archaeon]
MDISQVSFKNHILTWRLNVLMFGLIAGAISSLCVSSLILLTEKVIGIPVGTFYLIIIDALLHSSSTSVSYVTYGFILHIVTGTLLGFIIAIPFLRNKQYSLKLTKYSELYGSIFGFVIWAIFFVPISLMVVLPEISQISMVILQQTPTGIVSGINTNSLQETVWETIVLALPFNVFYGLVVGIIIKSFNEKYVSHLTSIESNIMK